MVKVGLLCSDENKEYANLFFAFQKEMDIEIIARYNVMGHNVKAVIRELEEKEEVEVIIARNPLSFFVKQYATVVTVFLNINEMDIIRAIKQSPLPVKKAAFFLMEYDEEKFDNLKEELENSTGCEIALPILETQASYDRNALERAFHMVEDCDCIVTGTRMMEDYFADHGKPALSLSASKYRVKDCLINAKNLALIQRRDKSQRHLVEMALASTKEFFVIMEDRRVVHVNDSFYDFLGIRKGALVGKTEDEFFGTHPFLRRISKNIDGGIVTYSGIEYVVVKHSDLVGFDNRENACIYSVSNVDNIQKKEYSVRRKLMKGGFKAKYTFADMISNSDVMNHLKENAKRYAMSGANLLITGESGTGKEILAQSIHNESAFKNGPFVAINCAAIPENLLESELFGYEDGAFTGAKKGGRHGMFELSQHGTLFLDEIGEIPMSLQVKLLRCIQERSVTRLGAEKPIPIENRIICATNKNLREQVRNGSFREDLYYRINVLRLEIPSLRERKQDIKTIAETFILKHAEWFYGDPAYLNYEIPERYIDMLKRYDWPGNVRELEAFVQRLLALGCTFKPEDTRFDELFYELAGIENAAEPEVEAARQTETLPEDYMAVRRGTMEEMQMQILNQTYQDCGENLQTVARVLGLGYSTVWRKLSKEQKK